MPVTFQYGNQQTVLIIWLKCLVSCVQTVALFSTWVIKQRRVCGSLQVLFTTPVNSAETNCQSVLCAVVLFLVTDVVARSVSSATSTPLARNHISQLTLLSVSAAVALLASSVFIMLNIHYKMLKKSSQFTIRNFKYPLLSFDAILFQGRMWFTSQIKRSTRTAHHGFCLDIQHLIANCSLCFIFIISEVTT